MTETRPARPQLSAVCLYLGGIFAIQLVRVLVVVVGAATPDGQDDVRRQIGWFRTDGASFDDAVSIYRIVLTVIAVLAAAGIVFAVYAARGDHPSRILLTVLAVVFLGVGLSGITGEDFFAGVLGFVGVVFAVQLWTPAARSWFRQVAGKEPLPVKPPTTPTAPDPFGQQSQPGGTQVQAPVQPPAPPTTSFAPGPYGQPQAYVPPGARVPLPRSVSLATWTAMIGSAVVAGLSVIVLLGMALIGSDYEQIAEDGGVGADLIRESGMDYDQLYVLSLVLFGICLVLSVGGMIAAGLVLARKRAGSTVLFVMTVVTIAVSVLFFPFGLPWTAAAIVALLQLLKPESKRWFVKT